MIDFHQAKMDVAADDSMEFYLAAGVHNAWVLIPAKLLALQAEVFEPDTEAQNCKIQPHLQLNEFCVKRASFTPAAA